MNEIKKEVLEHFWSIYDTEGTIKALSWLESLKYYQDFCQDDETQISQLLDNFSIHN